MMVCRVDVMPGKAMPHPDGMPPRAFGARAMDLLNIVDTRISLKKRNIFTFQILNYVNDKKKL
jgi:hypothetical protein